MREILFRGKGNPKYNEGNWYEGYLTHDTEDYQIYIPIGVRSHHTMTVLEETVGQFTGLTDKNGRKIFEGDILGAYLDDEFPDDYTMVKVIWHNNGWYTQQNKALPDMLEYADSQRFEVIGNIHDNPELLEQEE